jgi:hypothetical protein
MPRLACKLCTANLLVVALGHRFGDLLTLAMFVHVCTCGCKTQHHDDPESAHCVCKNSSSPPSQTQDYDKQPSHGMQVHELTIKLPDAAFGFFHDILVTENYYVILENPTRLNYWKLVTQYVPGKACIAECLYQDQNRPVKVCLAGTLFGRERCCSAMLPRGVQPVANMGTVV